MLSRRGSLGEHHENTADGRQTEEANSVFSMMFDVLAFVMPPSPPIPRVCAADSQLGLPAAAPAPQAPPDRFL